MAILKVKDDNGNWISIPAIKGDTGAPGPNGFSIYTITGKVPINLDKEGNDEVSREDIDNPTERVVQIGDFIYKSSSGELYNVVATSDTTVSMSYYATLKPKKGIDYWTPSDIAEIESYIDTAVVDTFGEGTSIPSGADLNEYTTIGKYYANAGSIAASLVNSPTKNNFMMYVFTRTTDGVPSQMIIDLSGKLYLRSRSTSAWQSWVTYMTKTDLDAKANKTEGVFFIEGSGTTDSTAKTSTWIGTSDRITAYYDGLTIRYKIGVAGQSTVTLNINGLGAKTVYRFGTTKLTTQFPVGSIITLIYHEDLNDGCWVTNDYDANTNTQQRVYKTTGNVEYPITTRYNTTTGASYYAEYGRYSEGVTLNPSTNTITATAFKGKLTGNADTATKATQDASGNNIANTYAKKSNAEEWIFTLEDGSTVTKKVVLG